MAFWMLCYVLEMQSLAGFAANSDEGNAGAV